MKNSELKSEMTKITFIIRSLQLGGAERVVSELGNYLAEKYQIEIITFDYADKEYVLKHNVKRKNLEFKKGKKSFINNVLKLKNYCHEINSDIYISFDLLANLYSLAALAFTDFKLGISERNAPHNVNLKWYSRLMRQCLYRTADFFVFQTEEAKLCYPKGIRKRSYVIPNPIKSGLPQKTYNKQFKTIVAIGRLSYQKNYLLMLDAFSIVHQKKPDIILKIYGTGNEFEALKLKCSKLNISENVFFMGNSLALHSEIVNDDVFVMSSRFEGIPNALLEAMGMGFPVIATDCPAGGPQMLINNGVNGYLVNNGDAVQLAETILKVINNAELSNRIGNNARVVNEIFSLHNISELWCNMFANEMRK